MRRTILLCAKVVCLVLAMSICGSARTQTDESEALSRRVKELFNAGKMDEAIPLAKRALSINEQALGSDHPTVATNLTELAKLYEAQGRYSEAEPLYMRALSIQEKALGPDRPDVVADLRPENSSKIG